MSWLCASGEQSIGISASVLPMTIQGWFPLGLTCLISLLFVVNSTSVTWKVIAYLFRYSCFKIFTGGYDALIFLLEVSENRNVFDYINNNRVMNNKGSHFIWSKISIYEKNSQLFSSLLFSMKEIWSVYFYSSVFFFVFCLMSVAFWQKAL